MTFFFASPSWLLNFLLMLDSNINVFLVLFHQRVKEVIDSHDPKQPLFLYMAFQNVHNPIQAPDEYVNKYNFIKQKMRRVHAGMADILDEAVGNITKMFKEKGYVIDSHSLSSEKTEFDYYFSFSKFVSNKVEKR